MVSFTCVKHGEYMSYEKVAVCSKCADEDARQEELEKEQARRAAVMASRWERCGMPSKFCGITIDEWIADQPKKQAVKDDALRFINGDISRMLLIGNCGTGKTMLAAGIIGEMAKDSYPVYSTATRLIRSIRETWRTKESEQEAMDSFINCDVLVVDELGAGRCTDDDKLILSEILCDRYAIDKPTLLISNMTGEQLKQTVLDERAVDRMREGGVVLTMSWESMRGKA